jgi:hypothetical protein
MTTMTDIDDLVAKVKALPIERQRDVIDVLRDLTAGTYQLSADELAVLGPALDDAKAGRRLVSLQACDERTRCVVAP